MSRCHHSGVDRVFRSLAAQRRRCILDSLMDVEAGRASFDELVDYVVEEETPSPAPDREAVATTLHHTHLPKLADEGFIEYERGQGVVTTTSRPAQIRP